MLATSNSGNSVAPPVTARASTVSITAKRARQHLQYLFEVVLEARRPREQQRVQVLVRRLPDSRCDGTCVASCSTKGKQLARFFYRVNEC